MQRTEPVVLIRTPAWVGDCVLAREGIWQLRRRLPRARLVVLTSERLSPLFSGLDVDCRPLPVGRSARSSTERIRLLRALKADVILLQSPSFRVAVEASLAGIPMRVGFNDDARTLLLSHPQVRPGSPPPHRRAPFTQHLALDHLLLADRTADLLAAPPLLPVPAPLLIGSPTDQHQVSQMLERLRPSGRPLIAIQPFSRGGLTRTWPQSCSRALLKGLLHDGRYTVLLLGGPEEGTEAGALGGDLLPPEQLLAGNSSLTLGQLAALSAHLRLLITLDTGPMHVAAASGCPTLVIYGSTLPDISGPWRTASVPILQTDLHCRGCYRQTCPYQLECLRNTTPQSVLEEALRWLNRE